MSNLLSLFPFIVHLKNNFEHQHKFLNKVALTGRINSNIDTKNLFKFTNTTNSNFAQLKDKLIKLLLKENTNKLAHELQSKAIISIDILIRNLYERTADVGFLATDTQIIDFLKHENISKTMMQTRLTKYVSKYSVYNEILIFDTEGNVQVNLNKNNIINSTKDKIIQETLQSDDYIERYAHTDIFKSQHKTLTYTQKILDNKKAIGVLCLCFQFDDEMQRIFKNLKLENEDILLVEKDKIIASTDIKKYNLGTNFAYIADEYKLLNKTFASSSKTNGYQGYHGLPWFAVALKDNIQSLSVNEESEILFKKSLLDQDITALIQEADDIVDDLADIIINGELIAAKKKMYILNPILESLRTISSDLLITIKDSVENLEALLQNSLTFNLKSSSALAIDIMDRNLYERANDCRWWALTPLFINELSIEEPNQKKLNDTLTYINNLYTVYSNIFIYDKKGEIIACSKDMSIIGTTINNQTSLKTLSNKDSQKYFVSPFEATPYYKNKPTYIYHASINNEKNTLGGIAIVFDSDAEFNAILDDSFTTNIKGVSLFIDNKSMVISSTDKSIEPLSYYPIDPSILSQIVNNDNFYTPITINKHDYILASSKSQGYREYKVNDNYTNDVFALTLIEL